MTNDMKYKHKKLLPPSAVQEIRIGKILRNDSRRHTKRVVHRCLGSNCAERARSRGRSRKE
jgi:hypothetical protein